MKILKTLYICWVSFWIFGCILVGIMGENATFTKMISLFIILICAPLLTYVASICLCKSWHKSKVLFFMCLTLILFLYAVFCVLLDADSADDYILLFMFFTGLNFVIYLVIKQNYRDRFQ